MEKHVMNKPWKIEQTFWVRIYMAGEIETAKNICRQECYERGLCVNIQPCDYIYTGGAEAGFVVELINYPRFPVSKHDLRTRAQDLALKLLNGCCQHSCCLMNPDTTYWYSSRSE